MLDGRNSTFYAKSAKVEVLEEEPPQQLFNIHHTFTW